MQISTIRIIKEAMREASFLYAELVSMGAPMSFCDVGGGLAVDYEVSTHRIMLHLVSVWTHFGIGVFEMAFMSLVGA